MANTIKILNSGVSSATPNSLEYGEIAINYSDGKLFYKNASSAIVGSALISDNYVATLTAGTGVTISGGTGLGSSPTISIGQDVGTTADVTFNTVTGTNGITTLTTVGQPSSTPSDGTLAVDVTNNILYFMSGSVWQPVTAGGSGASVTSTDTPPSSPSAGDLWFETDTGNLFIYYNDGSSSQWVDIGGSNVANISVSDSAPSGPVNGDLWFETDTARTFVYYNDGTTSQWVEIGSTAVSAAGIDGSIQFASNSTLAATPNFIWDDTNKRLGINNATPSYSLDVTGSARITAGVIADLTGNADTASALQTSRTIELTGDVTGSVSFDGSANVQISTTVANLTSNLNDLNDVDAASPSNGDFLRFDGVNWINDAVNLSTDTIGDYVDSLVAGTGVTVTNNSGEGATPTISIGQDVSTTSNVTFNNVTADLTGNADTASALQTSRTIELTGDVTGSALFDGSADITISTTVTGEVTSLNDLSDVTAATPSDGEFLKFNGTEWVAEVPDHGSLAGLGDDDHTIYLLADGTRVAAELTIAGDLTVDNSTLYVDSANNYVGIGTSTPSYELEVVGSALISQNAEVDGILTANHIHGNLAGALYLHVKNTSGSPIAAGTPVYATGSVGASGATEVAASDASSSSTMPSLGIVQSALAVNGEGHATVIGVIGGLNTAIYPVNTSLYVAPGGGLTSTRPTASSDLVQKIGRVIRSDASTGEILVLGAGRTNDIPNDITLGADTIGDYVGSLVAGTGVTLTNNSGEGATPTIEIGQDVSTTANVTFNTVNADVTGDLTGNASTASALQTGRSISLGGDLSGSASFDGSADITISATIGADSVALGADTTGDYVENLVAGTGVTLTNNSGEGATPTIAIGQDVGTTSNVTFNTVNADVTGDLTGDVYASDGTSKVLENGTNGTDATFTGDVTGDVTGTVSDISNHNLGDLGDVNFTIVSPATGDIVYFDGAEWINQPGSLNISTDVNISLAQDGDYLRYNGSEWVNDPINLGADTVGDYVKSLVAGTGVTLADNSGESATPSISIGQDVATTSNVTFNNLILTGDLTVSGTTTQINTTELLVEDNVVVLNTGSSATPSTNAGLEVERGDFSNVSIIWNETSDTWQFTNDGSTFYNLIVDDSFTLGSTNIQLGSTVTTVTGLTSVTSTSFVGDLTGNASTASALQTSRTIELVGDVTGLVSFDGSADVQIATIVTPDSVALGADTTGDYVESLVAGLGVTISNNSGEGATPNIAIGQDVATTSDVTFNTVTGTNGLITLTTAGAPTSSLADGAIAIDTNNNILYFRSGSTWQQVSGGVEISDAPPSSANEGDLWWESDTGRLKVYYNDGSSSQWVDAFTSGAGTVSSGSLLWTQFYYDGGSAPTGSVTGTLGENSGTWYEATAANYASTGLGSNNAADDPTLTGIVYSSATGRFTGFPQGVYQISFTGNAAIDAAGLTISTQKYVYLQGSGIYADFPINILPEAAYHNYPNFEAGFSVVTTAVMSNATAANNYLEVATSTQSSNFYGYYGYLSITKIG